jgi:thioredoxin 1
MDMTTIAVTDSSFESDVLKSDTPVVVDFWAEWCGPCKQIGPALEEIAGEMGDKVRIAKVNIDENPSAPTRYGVRGIPTLLIFKNGELVDRKVGADSKSGIARWIEDAI